VWLGRVERFVYEAVGLLVLLAADVFDRPLLEGAELVEDLRVQGLQVLVLDLVLLLHLADDQLRVADELDLLGLELLGEADAEQQRTVLGDVVGRGTDRLAALGEDLAGAVAGNCGDRSWAGVAPRAAVDIDRDPLQGFSISSTR
jgi:hypothetical protein